MVLDHVEACRRRGSPVIQSIPIIPPLRDGSGGGRRPGPGHPQGASKHQLLRLGPPKVSHKLAVATLAEQQRCSPQPAFGSRT